MDSKHCIVFEGENWLTYEGNYLNYSFSITADIPKCRKFEVKQILLHFISKFKNYFEENSIESVTLDDIPQKPKCKSIDKDNILKSKRNLQTMETEFEVGKKYIFMSKCKNDMFMDFIVEWDNPIKEAKDPFGPSGIRLIKQTDCMLVFEATEVVSGKTLIISAIDKKTLICNSILIKFNVIDSKS